MANCIDFRSQISAVMEVLANAAVVEICKVINEGYAVLRLEMSRTKRENESLKSKLKSIELLISQDIGLDSGTEGITAIVNKAQTAEQTDFAGEGVMHWLYRSVYLLLHIFSGKSNIIYFAFVTHLIMYFPKCV